MSCPYLDALGDKDPMVSSSGAAKVFKDNSEWYKTNSDPSPERVKFIEKMVAVADEFVQPSMVSEAAQTFHQDNSDPDHPVLRPDLPEGTSDDDPGAAGASRDDSRDTNV